MLRNTLNQWTVFYYSVFAGVLAALAYDVIRAFRRLIKAGWIVSALLDVMFWVVAAGLIFFALWQVNDGKPQIFAFTGAVIGACLYLLFVSPSVNSLFRIIKKAAQSMKAHSRQSNLQRLHSRKH